MWEGDRFSNKWLRWKLSSACSLQSKSWLLEKKNTLWGRQLILIFFKVTAMTTNKVLPRISGGEKKKRISGGGGQ